MQNARIELVLGEGEKLDRLWKVCDAVVCLDKSRKAMEEKWHLPPGTIVTAIPANGIELHGMANEDWILEQVGVPPHIEPRQSVYYTFQSEEFGSEKQLAWIDYVLVSQREGTAIIELMLGRNRVETKTLGSEKYGWISMLKCKAYQEMLKPVQYSWVGVGEWDETNERFELPIETIHVGRDPAGW